MRAMSETSAASGSVQQYSDHTDHASRKNGKTSPVIVKWWIRAPRSIRCIPMHRIHRHARSFAEICR